MSWDSTIKFIRRVGIRHVQIWQLLAFPYFTKIEIYLWPQSSLLLTHIPKTFLNNELCLFWPQGPGMVGQLRLNIICQPTFLHYIWAKFDNYKKMATFLLCTSKCYWFCIFCRTFLLCFCWQKCVITVKAIKINLLAIIWRASWKRCLGQFS